MYQSIYIYTILVFHFETKIVFLSASVFSILYARPFRTYAKYQKNVIEIRNIARVRTPVESVASIVLGQRFRRVEKLAMSRTTRSAPKIS